jgi:hypothetical protein
MQFTEAKQGRVCVIRLEDGETVYTEVGQKVGFKLLKT